MKRKNLKRIIGLFLLAVLFFSFSMLFADDASDRVDKLLALKAVLTGYTMPSRDIYLRMPALGNGQEEKMTRTAKNNSKGQA